jgi:hypothetical protein
MSVTGVILRESALVCAAAFVFPVAVAGSSLCVSPRLLHVYYVHVGDARPARCCVLALPCWKLEIIEDGDY